MEFGEKGAGLVARKFREVTTCCKCGGSITATLDLPRIGVRWLPNGEICGPCHAKWKKERG
jgi:hypothetical protein